MTFKLFQKKSKPHHAAAVDAAKPTLKTKKDRFIHQLTSPNPQIVQVSTNDNPSHKTNRKPFPKSNSARQLSNHKTSTMLSKAKSTNFLSKFIKKSSNNDDSNKLTRHQPNSNINSNCIRRVKSYSIESKPDDLNDILNPYEEMLVPMSDKKFLRSMFDKRLQYHLKQVHSNESGVNRRRRPIMLSARNSSNTSNTLKLTPSASPKSPLEAEEQTHEPVKNSIQIDEEVDRLLFNQQNPVNDLDFNKDLQLNEIPHSTEIDINESLVNNYHNSHNSEEFACGRSQLIASALARNGSKSNKRHSAASRRSRIKSSRSSKNDLKTTNRVSVRNSKFASATGSCRSSVNSVSTNAILNDLSSLDNDPLGFQVSNEENEPLMNHLSTIRGDHLEMELDNSIEDSVLLSKSKKLYVPSASPIRFGLQNFTSNAAKSGNPLNEGFEIFQDNQESNRSYHFDKNADIGKENNYTVTPKRSMKTDFLTLKAKNLRFDSKENVDLITFDDNDNVSHSTSKRDSYIFRTADSNWSEEHEKSSYPYTEFETFKDVNFQVFRRSANPKLKMISPSPDKRTQLKGISEDQHSKIDRILSKSPSPNTEIKTNNTDNLNIENGGVDNKRTREDCIEYYTPPNPTNFISRNEVYRNEMLSLIETHSLMVNKKQEEISHLKDLLLQERKINTFLASTRADVSPKLASSPKLSSPSPTLSPAISPMSDSNRKIRKSFIPMNITVTEEPKPRNYLPYNLGKKHLLPPFELKEVDFDSPGSTRPSSILRHATSLPANLTVKNTSEKDDNDNDDELQLKPFHKFKVTSPQQVDLMNYDVMHLNEQGVSNNEDISVSEEVNEALNNNIYPTNNASLNESIQSIPLVKATELTPPSNSVASTRNSCGSRTSATSCSYFTACDDSIDDDEISHSLEDLETADQDRDLNQHAFLFRENQLHILKSTPRMFGEPKGLSKRDFSGSTTASSIMSRAPNMNDSIMNSSLITSATTPESIELEFDKR